MQSETSLGSASRRSTRTVNVLYKLDLDTLAELLQCAVRHQIALAGSFPQNAG
jgi:hypothetical protein